MNRNFSQDKVREMLDDFRNEHFEPSWKRLASEIGMQYTYLIDFKSGLRDVGPETLDKIVTFISEN